MKFFKAIFKSFGFPQILYLFGDIFLYVYIVISFMTATISDSSLLYSIGKIVMTIGGFLGFCSYYKYLNKHIVTFVGLLVVSFGFCHVLGENDFEDISLLFYSIVHLGLALNLASHKRSSIISGIIYYVSISCLLFALITGSIYSVMEKTSYNFISVIAIFTLGTYIITLEQNKKNLPLLAVFLYSYLTVNSFGRANVLSGLALLFLYVIYLISCLPNNVTKYTAFFVMLFCFLCFMYYCSCRGLFKKFEDRGIVKDDSRFAIWSAFAEESIKNPITFLVGGDAARVRKIDCNMHNSFLQCYVNYGVVSFMVVILLSLNSLIVYWQQKNKTLFIFAFLILLRACTDKLFFKGYCEFYLYYLIFYAYSPKRIFQKKIEIFDLKENLINEECDNE